LRDKRLTALAAAVIILFAIGCSASSGRVADWLVWSVALAAATLVSSKCGQYSGDSSKASEVTLQQLTRMRGVEGVESIRGTLVAEFAPGERTVVLHVAFCPPFERLPSVEVETDGCVVKIAQVLHQGTRLEVRLERDSDVARRIPIEFHATDRQSHAV
jgi:hypothetical protein